MKVTVKRFAGIAVSALCAVGLLAPAASADHGTRPSFELRALGHAANPGTFPDVVNSDLAFWGNLAFNGSYDGFRIINIASKRNPQEIVHQQCEGSQGDVVVWNDILVRSYNSPAEEGASCDGQPIPEGFEGLHVFDITNVHNPDLVASVELPCGSHTATAVPDRANNRLIVYNQASGGPCYFFDIVEVPFDNPDQAQLLWQEPLRGQHGCHDSGVILGEVNMMACASGSKANVFDIGANDHPGGRITNPRFLYTVTEPGVGEIGSWHSAAFTWDGEVLILGWEPGGGAAPECEATDPAVKKSAFFYDAHTGEKLGQWTLPRPQTEAENCTIHNYNVVPLRDRYIMTMGNYQAGTWVVDFTDPARAFTRAFSDPEPLTPTQLGGAWSSYWYNDTIYESSITEGLNIFRYTEPQIRRAAIELGHLNPQTQEFSLAPLDSADKKAAAQERRRITDDAAAAIRGNG